MTNLEKPFISERKKEQQRKLTEYAVFDAMMQAVDEGEFTREEAIASLQKEEL